MIRTTDYQTPETLFGIWARNSGKSLDALPLGLDLSQKAFAEINHSRWIARCPFCPGAELVTPGDPRFFCGSCGNNGGTFLKVEFPKHKDEIEAELLKRTDERTRNWNLTESVKKLQDENKEQGVV